MSDYDFTFAHREEGFDNHIEKSIRGYNNLIDDVIGLSRYFVESGTTVIDLGCSTGKMLCKIAEHNKDIDHVSYKGIELCDTFFDEIEINQNAILNPSRMNDASSVEFYNEDIRYHDYKTNSCSLMTSIFTLQFMPRHDRAKTLQNIFNALNTGGAYIFAEKLLCEDAQIQEMLTFLFYDHKKKNFTLDDIMTKEHKLRGMLRPNTYSDIVSMLKWAGFSRIEPFWRNYMFIGCIAIK